MASPGELNDLFDYDIGLDDAFNPTHTESNAKATNPVVDAEHSGLGLGLDEEVKVAKKRKPVPKLDESRLLSERGVRKLRASAKSKLKFKGKGYEFLDAERLLNFYQLWLDDLFPRAKFADGLAMIEKLGHSKRVQSMRREWINEEKPGTVPHTSTSEPAPGDESLPSLQISPNADQHIRQGSDVTSPGHLADVRQQAAAERSNPAQPDDPVDDSLFFPQDGEESYTKRASDISVPEDDELDALLREQEDELMGT